MSEQWTAKMSDEVRKAADIILQEGNPLRAFLLHQMVGAIESQRAELEAARAVVGRTRTMLSTMTIADENDIFNKHRVKKAIDAYDALRSQQTTSGEGDSDE